MHIGIISPPWAPVPPPAYGGTESVLDRLARGLVAAGHDVLLAAPDNSTCPVPRVPGLPVAPLDAPLTGEGITELRHVVHAYAAMAEMDVVHDHTLAGPLYRHRPAHLPVVTTNHGPFQTVLSELYEVIARDVAIIAISHHQAAMAKRIPIAAVIHHGIDVERVPFGAGVGGYACFLGRMSPDKGPREAVLVARTAGVPLRMAAKVRERAEREYFMDQVEPLLGGDIEFLGEIGEQEKYELLADAFALLNPIQWPEPFGLVMIEALAAGTPVVVTPAGAAPEIVDDGVTGYLCRDVEALADALIQAKDLDRASCRAATVARFSTERMVADHVALFEKVVQDAADQAPLRSGTSLTRLGPQRQGSVDAASG
jgi:glycosyltransferase involved in cell wall biosynthesis